MTDCEHCGHADTEPMYPMEGTHKYQVCGCQCHFEEELSDKETIEGMITGKIPIDGEDD